MRNGKSYDGYGTDARPLSPFSPEVGLLGISRVFICLTAMSSREGSPLMAFLLPDDGKATSLTIHDLSSFRGALSD